MKRITDALAGFLIGCALALVSLASLRVLGIL
jgi:hypothetical protein